MRQLFLKVLNWVTRFFQRLFGVRVDEKPTAASKTESSLAPPAFAEPELELASAEPSQYRKRNSLFTYRERMFYKTLIEEVGDEYQIFTKVRMGDVVYLANEPANRKFHNNQIFCKHLDFVVCEIETYKPIVAIELDDSSHNRLSRQDSDEFKERVCKDTGLLLLRFKVQQTYPQGYVGSQIRSKLQK